MIHTQIRQRLGRLGLAFTLLGLAGMIFSWGQIESYWYLGLLMIVLGIYCGVASKRLK